MNLAVDQEPSSERPLRLWPGVAIVAIQWLGRFVLPPLFPQTLYIGIMGGMFLGLAVVLWWLFFSRAPWAERLSAVALMGLALALTPKILDKSLATAGMGMLFYVYAVPVLSLAFVGWALVSRRLSKGPRYAAMAAAIFLACGMWALMRTGGITGDAHSDLAWRWSQTPEEKLVAAASHEAPATGTAAAAWEGAGDWPGFRGANRNSSVAGAHLKTDWSGSPPTALWRRQVGPGWSSFAVHGDLFYTQEQRGEDEEVSCYRVATGEPVWSHRDKARFWESNAGAGPRGTPTLAGGRVYTFGATGLVNVLDAKTGELIWRRDAAADAQMKTPTWGFSSSPLVLGDSVIVGVSGRLVAYDLETGKPRWLGPAEGASYSSPQLATVDGVPQVLLLAAKGLVSVAPSDGKVLWQHSWEGYPIVQPAQTAEGDVLIAVNADSGTRRLAVTQQGASWNVQERWTSNGLKPYFNDFVVHRGHAFGFDGRILSCIDLANGERKWKGGRYGNGQLVLLPDQDLLLVLTELGELALVKATPDQFTELARFPAIEGKTWNHPVLVGDVLLVRNGEQMAAFRLPVASG
ncbi:MAG TPA: PQQ-like beta-propeller repeat protein [Thermoanaerobaculia bacterium]|nr:PQQ-like beta-propeller repeat protein [Thermoanaerobaculia bacterium]